MSDATEANPTKSALLVTALINPAEPNETNPEMITTPEAGTGEFDAIDAEMSATTSIAPERITIRPRIRAGAIAWGLIVCAISVTVLVTVSSPATRSGFLSWALTLGPGGQALVLVLGLGVFILLLAGLSLIRRAQRKLASRRS